jgi:hypothetical protein
MFPLRRSRYDGNEEWDCKHADSIEQLCDRIVGANVRTDRGGWCGCDDNYHNHHVEHNGGDKEICV